ncbi:MAG: hypothetical protein AAFZ38_11180 [Myxococcota bacterium]
MTIDGAEFLSDIVGKRLTNLERYVLDLDRTDGPCGHGVRRSRVSNRVEPNGDTTQIE